MGHDAGLIEELKQSLKTRDQQLTEARTAARDLEIKLQGTNDVLRSLRETIAQQAYTVHTAFHIQTSGWWACREAFCVRAQEAAPTIAEALRVVQVTAPPAVHILLSGATLCGKSWFTHAQQYPKDRWVSISSRDEYKHVDCAGCLTELRQLPEGK